MQFLALGWGLMTMALPALMEMRALYMVVEVGFVEGIRAATTPTGTPTSQMPFSGCSRRMPTVFRSFMASQVMVLPRRFFSTLSCHTPKPVSSTASLARRSAWAAQAAATSRQMWSICSWESSESCRWASTARATRFRTSCMERKSLSNSNPSPPLIVPLSPLRRAATPRHRAEILGKHP